MLHRLLAAAVCVSSPLFLFSYDLGGLWTLLNLPFLFFASFNYLFALLFPLSDFPHSYCSYVYLLYFLISLTSEVRGDSFHCQVSSPFRRTTSFAPFVYFSLPFPISSFLFLFLFLNSMHITRKKLFSSPSNPSSSAPRNYLQY